MFEIRCYDEKFKEITHLTQWDVNRFIIVKSIDVDTVPEFHFCNKKTELAIPVLSRLVKDENDKNCYIAEIPDILLQQPFDIIVYIYVDSVVENKISSKTTHMARIPLVPRPKPEDYPYEVVESHIDYLGKLIAQATELEESLKNGIGSLGVNPDHAQNDSTQPDYIKNRLAYYCRKCEDMQATEYSEPILGIVKIEEDGDVYQQPILLKFHDLPENVTPHEIIEELIGISGLYWDKDENQYMEEILRLDDQEMFPPEKLQYIKREKIFDKNGQQVGAYLVMEDIPNVVVTDVDNLEWNYTISYEDNGEIYEETFIISIPEKGIYTAITDSEEDDESGEIIKYYAFDKIFFKDVKRIDKALLPPEALSPKIEVDDYVNWGSENPITSNAVAQALDRKIDKPSKLTEGYVLGVYKDAIQLIPMQTGVSQSVLDNAINGIKNKLPLELSNADDGKILMVQNGVWTAVKIPFVEEEEY